MTVALIIRMARPVGPKSSRRCGLACARSGRMLAPTSRVPARSTAPAATTRVNAKIGNRAAGRGAVRGWSCSTQPSGLNQIIQCRPTPASAIIRMA